MENKKYLDTVEAAEFLKISPRTLKAWKKDGRIGAKKLGKKLYWSIESLNALIER